MNKTVLITGAAKGIGAAIAKEFARSGYQVCINYNTSKESANALKKELDEIGYSSMIYQADISDRNQVDKMVDSVLDTFGNIDVLVNNAGICEYKLFTDITIEDIQNMLNVSVIGTFHVTQSVLKKCMIHKKAGKIINISSIWGMVGSSMEVNYSTAKAAVIGMSKALAKELGPSGITVNVVAPGAIDTDMNAILTQEELKEFCENVPLERIGHVDDISGVVKFLASKEAEYITGQVISPNGGIVV
ncbi:MAG: 3-oxoacyl-ACP reductase family protein [Clostridia bacterium]|nr:3-oxoacyl-ACP reductase family protein [Clostridia bacterium]